ncbi:hypothetical protein CERSUDRAFT_93038 [Gelatoporia subvermispora B]|uniref:F-box domain-containing protein n=1 Tax=Ceriporiopsis subvermispora (strain B) TaxID=914234 RepID=M2QPM7_CERS8|nr:hypothetical protein CERSUDRAFT_93038 [Gelatoporia subvermispora B]
MHRCLKVNEILGMIMGYVPSGEPTGRATLAALARTCQVFHELALDSLWHHQDDLLNLLRCFPEDAWTFTEAPTMSFGWSKEPRMSHFDTTRSLGPEDWIRFDHYARRIRGLGTQRDYGTWPEFGAWGPDGPSDAKAPEIMGLSASVYVEFRIRRSTSPLFPSLRQLYWDGWRTDGTNLHFVELLLGRRLQRLNLSVAEWKHKRPKECVLSLICALPDSCPELRELEVSKSYVALTSIARVLPSLRHLRSLSVSNGSAANFVVLLRSLQAMPVLESLRLCDMWVDMDASDVGLANRGISVASLDIEESSPGFVSGLLQILQPRRARSISLRMRHSGSQAWGGAEPIPLYTKLHKMFTVLEDSCDPSELESIHVECPIRRDNVNVGDADAPEEPCPRWMLEPLLSFGRLAKVDISLNADLVLDDAALQNMALSWPRLQVLNLNGGKWIGEGHPHSTFAAVAHLARHCPDLVGFSLAIDNSCTASEDKFSSRETTQHERVKWMQLGDSALGNKRRLVHLLVNLFPCLEQIRSSAESEDAWNTVMELEKRRQREDDKSSL